jgi:hypothetical protein
MLETQNTVYDGDTISGEMVIRFDKVRLDDFLSYRMRIRSITGLGNIHLHHTSIEEQALIRKVALEKPEVPPTPPDAKVVEDKWHDRSPGLKPGVKKERVPYLTFKFRKFFNGQTGNTYAEVIEKFHLMFPNHHKSDADIIALFKRVQGIQ